MYAANTSSPPPSRRVRQTREQLENALGSLLNEMPYEAIHIEDVTNRAGVARTTFYLHFEDKDALFLSWMQRSIGHLDPGFATREDWLSEEPSPQFVALFNKIQRKRRLRVVMFSASRDLPVLMRGMENMAASQFEARLHAVFKESDSRIPFAVLARAVACALVWIMNWWVQTHTCTAEEAARFAQQIIRAAVRDALRL